MNTEELIRASVREHTDGMAPPVDVSGLVRRGRRRRVVNLAGTALAVGVLVAGGVVGASALTGGDGSTRGGPEVAGESAGIEGPVALPGPSEVFVMADGRVSLGGVVSDARPRDSLHITRDGVAYSGPGAVPYLLTTDGRDVALAPEQPQRPDSSYTGWVAADPAGSLVAWTEVSPQGADLVLYDTSAQREVARRSVECGGAGFAGPGGSCPRVYVMSDGLVIVNGRGVYGWDPLGRTEATEPYFAIDTLELLQAHGRTVARPDWNADASYDGLPADWRVAPIDENDLLSFDGQWTLSGLTVTSVDDRGTSVELDPPGAPVEAQFDLDGSVLVVTEVDGGFQVVDCAFDGADCAPVSGVEDEPMHLVLTDS